MTKQHRTISDYQYVHLKDFLASYAADHACTYADMGRQAYMGAGSVARVAQRRKPTWLFVRRLAAGLAVPLDDLLGPEEPVAAVVPPLSSLTEALAAQLTADLSSSPCLELLTIQRACLEELRGIYEILREHKDKPELYPRLF